MFLHPPAHFIPVDMTNYTNAIQKKFLEVEAEQEEVPNPADIPPADVPLASTDLGRQSPLSAESEVPNQAVLDLSEATETDQARKGKVGGVQVDLDAELDDLFA